MSILWLHRRVAYLPAEFRQDRLPNPHRTGNGMPTLRILPAKRVSLHLAEQQSQLPSGQSKSTCQDHTPREAQSLSGCGTSGFAHEYTLPTLSVPGAADRSLPLYSCVCPPRVFTSAFCYILLHCFPLHCSLGAFCLWSFVCSSRLFSRFVLSNGTLT